LITTKRFVEVVGDAARQLTDRLDPLRLPQLSFESLALDELLLQGIVGYFQLRGTLHHTSLELVLRGEQRGLGSAPLCVEQRGMERTGQLLLQRFVDPTHRWADLERHEAQLPCLEVQWQHDQARRLAVTEPARRREPRGSEALSFQLLHPPPAVVDEQRPRPTAGRVVVGREIAAGDAEPRQLTGQCFGQLGDLERRDQALAGAPDELLAPASDEVVVARQAFTQLADQFLAPHPEPLGALCRRRVEQVGAAPAHRQHGLPQVVQGAAGEHAGSGDVGQTGEEVVAAVGRPRRRHERRQQAIGHCAASLGCRRAAVIGCLQRGEAAARGSSDELRRQLFAVRNRRTAQLREQHLDGAFAEVVERGAHGGEWQHRGVQPHHLLEWIRERARPVENRVVVDSTLIVVEADQADVVGGAQVARLQRRQRTDGMAVTRADYRIDPTAVDEQLRNALSRLFPAPVQRRRSDEGGIDGQPMPVERVEISLVTGLRTGVLLGSPDIGDPAMPMHLDQMADRRRHAAAVVHHHGRVAGDDRLDGDQWERIEPAAERRELLAPDMHLQPHGPHDQTIEALSRSQLIDRIGLGREVARVFQLPADERDQVRAELTGRIGRTHPLRLMQLDEAAQQHSDHRPAGRRSALRSWPGAHRPNIRA